MQTVLISGASAAGPAPAWWLRHRSFSPMLVERAPAPLPIDTAKNAIVPDDDADSARPVA